jgi:hypothetical protein
MKDRGELRKKRNNEENKERQSKKGKGKNA